jgi:hypothetical protein
MQVLLPIKGGIVMAKGSEVKKTGAFPSVKWDDAKLKTTYANVCNVSSTREEVTLLFGTNQTWNSGQKEVTVELNDRIIVSPYAAKRLLMLLTNVVGQYEKRFGELNIEMGPVSAPVEKA